MNISTIDSLVTLSCSMMKYNNFVNQILLALIYCVVGNIQYADRVSENPNRLLIDCFLFYNELDMLTFRLKELDHIVDYFVLVESQYTHQGVYHPLVFNTSKHLFEAYNHKIIHVMLTEDVVKINQTTTHQEDTNKRENYHRNCITIGIQTLSNILHQDDMIIISDLDEIPDTQTISMLKTQGIMNIYHLFMDMYYYHINCKLNVKWEQAFILPYILYDKYTRVLNYTLTDLRMNLDNTITQHVVLGGWHFSYFGNSEFIINKLKSFSHTLYNNNKYLNNSIINEAIYNNNDILQRTNTADITATIPKPNNSNNTVHSSDSSISDNNNQSFCTRANKVGYITSSDYLPNHYKLLIQFGWF